MAITKAFDEFRKNLELTEAQQKEATRQSGALRDNLKTHLGGIAREFISGSFGRGTAIRPLHDIDFFVVLDPSAHRDVYPTASPKACLNKVLRALDAAYPNKDRPRLQDRSVNIVFSGTGFGYDVVPAFENRAGVYIIPDRGRDAWIETDTKAHNAALVAADKKAGSKLNPLIKMVKQWKTAHQVPLRSFHLEVMSYGAFTSAPARFPEGVHALFTHLANAVQIGCPNPAGVGPALDLGMTQEERTKPREKLVEAATKAKAALDMERAGRIPDAHRIWRGLFGDAFPAM